MAVIAHLTDLHLRPAGVLTVGRVDADRFTVRAIDTINRRHPDLDAVIVSGDVTDRGEEEAYTRAAMLLSRFSAPVLVVPGNHDVTPALQEAFCAFPGHAEPVVAGRACHARLVAGVTVVALDTAVPGAAYGTLGAAQLVWLDGVLAAAGPALIAMHHPPFPVGIGFMDAIGLKDADSFAAVVSRHANVARIVCGHVHRTIVGSVGAVPAVAIPGVAHQVPLSLDEGAPAAMVMEPPAYAVHLVTDGRAVTHIGYVDDYGPDALFEPPEPEAA